MQKIFVVLLFLASIANAGTVRVDVLEKSTGKSTNYWFEVGSLAPVKGALASIREIPQSSIYSLRNGKLTVGGVAISAADDILFQCAVEGFDLVIVRVEHNSISNPLRVLTAVSGHPIQVSTIYILKIKNHVVVLKREIIHKPASYEWSAKVSQ
jgi:hypothetical protein